MYSWGCKLGHGRRTSVCHLTLILSVSHVGRKRVDGCLGVTLELLLGVPLSLHWFPSLCYNIIMKQQ